MHNDEIGIVPALRLLTSKFDNNKKQNPFGPFFFAPGDQVGDITTNKSQSSI